MNMYSGCEIINISETWKFIPFLLPLKKMKISYDSWLVRYNYTSHFIIYCLYSSVQVLFERELSLAPFQSLKENVWYKYYLYAFKNS